MKILFSPVGNSDPYRNFRDGAMLHIVRHYKPDKVVLFFTKSIYEGDKRDISHNEYNWDALIKSVSRNTVLDVTDMHVEDIKTENDFDAYKVSFHNIIQKLYEDYPEAEILLNVTSGTPQMEATLCLEYITYPKNKRCIQVSTPIKSSNANMEYDKKEISELEMIELVNEEEKKCETRCKEINILSFRESMVKNQVRALIKSYNYYGAKILVDNEIQIGWNNSLILKLNNVINSINDNKVFEKIEKKEEYNKEFKKALFAVLLIDLRLKQSNYSDALVRIKNVAEFLAVMLIRKTNKNFLEQHNGKYWVVSKEYCADFIKYIPKKNAKFDGHTPLNLHYYIKISKYLLNVELTQKLEKIDKVNELRNKVAHSLDEVDINKNSRIIFEANAILIDILKMINPKINDNILNYFNNFNEELDSLL